MVRSGLSANIRLVESTVNAVQDNDSTAVGADDALTHLKTQLFMVLGHEGCARMAEGRILFGPYLRRQIARDRTVRGRVREGRRPAPLGRVPAPEAWVRGEGRALAARLVQGRGPSPRTKQRKRMCSQDSALLSTIAQ